MLSQIILVVMPRKNLSRCSGGAHISSKSILSTKIGPSDKHDGETRFLAKGLLS